MTAFLAAANHTRRWGTRPRHPFRRPGSGLGSTGRCSSAVEGGDDDPFYSTRKRWIIKLPRFFFRQDPGPMPRVEPSAGGAVFRAAVASGGGVSLSFVNELVWLSGPPVAFAQYHVIDLHCKEEVGLNYDDNFRHFADGVTALSKTTDENWATLDKLGVDVDKICILPKRWREIVGQRPNG
eukprot:g17066.t1